MFSKACEYAIKAMVFIEYEAAFSPTVKLHDIATAIDSPEAFTAKILQKLRKAELLESTVGQQGGFRIAANRDIHLKDIVLAIDGDGIFTNCVLGLKKCSGAHPCPLHEQYGKIRGEMEQVMRHSRLSDVAKELANRKISLK